MNASRFITHLFSLSLTLTFISCESESLEKLLSKKVVDPNKVYTYNADIKPILDNNCVSCHGPSIANSGFRFDSYIETLNAVDSSNRDSSASILYQSITATGGLQLMPTTGSLPQNQITAIAKWIKQGSKEK